WEAAASSSDQTFRASTHATPPARSSRMCGIDATCGGPNAATGLFASRAGQPELLASGPCCRSAAPDPPAMRPRRRGEDEGGGPVRRSGRAPVVACKLASRPVSSHPGHQDRTALAAAVTASPPRLRTSAVTRSERMSPMNPNDMMAAVATSLKARTGRTLEEWVALVQASGIDPLDQNAVRRWLRAEHGVPQNSQWAIADAAARAAGWVPPTLEQSIDEQYAGAKAALRPIFDRLRQVLESFGD